MKSIRSASNADFKRWRRIAGSTRYMYSQGLTLAEGIHLARAVLAASQPIEAALVRAGAEAELADCIARIDPAGVHVLAPPLYDALAPVEHGAGLLLVVRIPPQPAPHAPDGDVLYLDGVQDPGNVGALLRVAAAAQVGHVLAGPGTAALWSPKALRAGQGAHFGMTLVEDVAAEQLAAWFRGPWIGTEAHAAEPLWSAKLPREPVGWMFGSEGAGLSAEARARCSLHVRIPLAAGVESLNVASAAAVCLFERQRQRQA